MPDMTCLRCNRVFPVSDASYAKVKDNPEARCIVCYAIETDMSPNVMGSNLRQMVEEEKAKRAAQ